MNRKFQLIPVALLILAVSGCASVKNIDSQDTGEGIKWKELKQAGICEEASRNTLTGNVKTDGRSSFFPPETENIVWWGVFGTYTFMTPAKLNAKWYEPGGTVFHEDGFSTGMWDTSFAIAVFPVKKLSALQYEGEWKLEIFYKDKVIDRRKFFVGTLNDKKENEPLAVIQAEKTVTESKSPAPDAAFLDTYEKAGNYFKNNDLTGTRSELESILKAEPYRTEAHLGLAAIAFKENNKDKTLQELDYLIQNPEYRDRAMTARETVLGGKKTS